ncbi:hypothetical protein OUZ56_017681 [Daphnia magna]|uniref:Uncharacterized protein n=1 Tax=Daphnia magna TaxID=35525 RepID=A0ABR0ATK9_9CRUS|nr:hypothetical protein OUZ56_017681 [Daphnia magna]
MVEMQNLRSINLTFSEEETERWEDAEEEEGSGEHGEEQPEWDFTDLRRDHRISQVGARHAMAAQIKFQSPPTFGGRTGRRRSGCIDTKESGDIIDGEMEELRDHVELSPSGAAQKWYSYKEAAGQLAAEWEDVAGPPIAYQELKTQLLEQFKPVNQNRFNEAKLRERTHNKSRNPRSSIFTTS